MGNVKFIDKKSFYKHLRRCGRYHSIFLFMPINTKEGNYELIFDWTDRLPDGNFNPIMTAKLIDKEKTGRERQAGEINFDCIENRIDSDFKLYKFLEEWITICIVQHEINKGMKDAFRNIKFL